MKANVLKGGWVWGDRALNEGDEVDASEAQVAAWEADGYVRRLPQKAQREEKVETAEAKRGGAEKAVKRAKKGK